MLAPENPEVRGLKATLDYRDGAREAALAMAEAVLAERPGNVAAHMVLIADRMQAGDHRAALARADTALARVPEDEGLHLARLAALEAAGEEAEVGAELKTMAGRFPANAGVRRALIQWHLRQGDVAAAEAVLRDLAAAAPQDPQGHLTVVQFLLETRGAAAARAELDRLIAEAADPAPFRRARAGLDFAEGRRAEAIAALTALTEGAEPSDSLRDNQVMLAEMLGATGDAGGRDALIATVLEADPDHTAALKLRARAAIEADTPELAIADMRRALGQAPRDPEIMTILAFAHERAGERTLAGEQLALAVETSAYGAEESLRYARFLMQEDRSGPAEGVVVDALRRAPEHPGLLTMLGRIHLARSDWARARQVAGILRGLKDPAAAAMATELEMARLSGENRREEIVATLETLTADGGAPAALARLVRAHVEAGDLAAAEAAVAAALARDPGDRPARMLRAGLYVLEGEPDAAEALYRGLIAEAPALVEPHRALFALLAGEAQPEAARAALAAGLAATGNAPSLRFAQAGFLEATGDFEGAIAVYEALYAEDTTSPVLANNLASLITSHRQDPASLDRAFRIARRLSGTDVPYFQDTYGWILHLRGDPQAALAYLEPAAARLTDNALVQFHLAEVQLALGDRPGARAAYARAVEAAGPATSLPQIAAAKARLAEIDAAPAAAPAPDVPQPAAKPAPGNDG